jgi:hypothetical protein
MGLPLANGENALPDRPEPIQSFLHAQDTTDSGGRKLTLDESSHLLRK